MIPLAYRSLEGDHGLVASIGNNFPPLPPFVRSYSQPVPADTHEVEIADPAGRPIAAMRIGNDSAGSEQLIAAILRWRRGRGWRSASRELAGMAWDWRERWARRAC
jgi:hypothetical protein